MSAFCAWIAYWRQAVLNGDHTSAARAAHVIEGAPEWRAIRAEDPDPTTTARSDAGLGPSQFGWILPYSQAVQAGNRAEVDRLITDRTYGQFFWEFDAGFRRWIRTVHARSRYGREAPWTQYKHYLSSGQA